MYDLVMILIRLAGDRMRFLRSTQQLALTQSNGPRYAFREVSRADLVSRYQGGTAQQTESVITSSLGGVLLIDEAYSLKQGPEDTYGQECIDSLTRLLTVHAENLIVILTGCVFSS